MRGRSYVIPAEAGIHGGVGYCRRPAPATWMPVPRLRGGRLFAGMTIIHPGRTLNIYLSTVTPLHRGTWLRGGPHRRRPVFNAQRPQNPPTRFLEEAV